MWRMGNPWREMERMRRELDDAFERVGYGRSCPSFPLVNLYEGKDELTVVAEMPGVSKDDITISAVEGTLTISGKRPDGREREGQTVLRSERCGGDFEKQIRIPTKIENEKIEASFSDGILSIKLPKAEEAKPRQINIV